MVVCAIWWCVWYGGVCDMVVCVVGGVCDMVVCVWYGGVCDMVVCVIWCVWYGGGCVESMVWFVACVVCVCACVWCVGVHVCVHGGLCGVWCVHVCV